jgi:hypothetical protein
MGRVYKLPIDAVAIGTAVQDIFAVKCGAGVGVILHAIHLDSINTAAAPCRMRLKRGTATVTLGSGGSSVTPVPAGINDSAAASTAHINDTSQASTSGAFTTIMGFNWDTVLPFDYLPPPEHRESCILNQGFVFDLPAVITAVTISGYLVFEEIP